MFRRRKRKCNYLRLEITLPVSAIAKRFIVAETASAKGNGRPTGQIEFVSVLIEYLKITFDFNATVALDHYSCRHVSLSLLLNFDNFFFDMRKYKFFNLHRLHSHCYQFRNVESFFRFINRINVCPRFGRARRKK